MPSCGRWKIGVEGTVQGVGFRPFVYRLARSLEVTGFVQNTTDGVMIEAEAPIPALEKFVSEIRTGHPSLARVHNVVHEEIESKEDSDFQIIVSKSPSGFNTEISPDIAPCDECARELLNSSDRRHSYPFINCTNCGPRYSIIQSLPYDRPKTTMQKFEMCDACADEYRDPENRRFHAQPNACHVCGPRVFLTRFYERTNVPTYERTNGAEILSTAELLNAGKIVAIKGVGGFHLACDATNSEAVMELRRRKRRDEKPFAVMVADIGAAKTLCHISVTEEMLLTSPERPIVLLKKKAGPQISDAVAPNNKNLGLMLPSSPLHYLLFNFDARRMTHDLPAGRHGARRVLVMTSANISDEPLVYTNADALERLAKIADGFLMHDRDIHIRIDDSIARVVDGKSQIIRRARGYTPAPIRLEFEMPPVLALGADLKSAICITRGRNAYLSQHLGDLENPLAHKSFEETVEHLQNILGVTPKIIAHDLHPNYFSTRFAYDFCQRQATSDKRQLVAVQHHHAHIASCMAENNLPDENVIGIALDGTGFGTDGTSWGGEVLIANYKSFERAARFKPVPMPGGDAAAKEPWRMAISYLSLVASRQSLAIDKLPLSERIDSKSIQLISEMIEKNINCPMTSSCGRLFDAVASLIGLRTVNSFEGQAAIELEQIADEREGGIYNYDIGTRDQGPGTIDFGPMIEEIVSDLSHGTPNSTISTRFHNTVMDALVKVCLDIKTRVSNLESRVCCSGGSLQNAILATRLKKRLEHCGFRVYTQRLVPPNDGGIALGQAVIAAHKFRDS